MNSQTEPKIYMSGSMRVEMTVNASDSVDAGCQLGVQLLVLPMKDIIGRMPIDMRKEIQFGALMAMAVDFHTDHGTEEFLSSLESLKRNATLHQHAEAQNAAAAQAQQTNLTQH